MIDTPDSCYALRNAIAPVCEVPNCDFSIPIIRERYGRTTLSMRVRTQEDEMLSNAAGPGRRPTARAIRMANAIQMERLLTTGKFGSASQLSRMIGVSQPHITNMLNLPPDEIERILFETK